MKRSHLSILLRRGLGFWIGVRLLFMGGAAVAQVPTTPTPLVSALIAAVTSGLVLFDVRASGEDVLLGNFGTSQLQITLIPFGLAALIEVLGHVLHRAAA